MRVLVVGMTFNPGGIESVIMEHYRKIDRTKIQFDFIITDEHMAYENEAIALGARIYHIHSRHDNVRLFYADLDAFMAMHASEFGAIWVNLCNLINLNWLKYAKKYGIPKRIIHCHNSKNMDDALHGFVHVINRQKVRKYATDFWTCSEDAIDWFYGKGIRKEPGYLYIPNAINPLDCQFDSTIRLKVRNDMQWNNKIILGNVGRLHSQKNQGFLIHSLSTLLKSDSRYKLVLIGDGEERESLEREIILLGLEDSVELLGMRKDIKQLYQGLDVFLLPSLYEGVSIALLEAQANGLPCLISDTQSSAGIVNNNVVRLPISEGNEKKWTKAVADLGDNPQRAVENNIPGSKYDLNEQINDFERRILMR